MERWSGRVAVVTGASSGIGAAIATDLAKHGMIVIGVARRQEKLDELCASLPVNVKGRIIPHKCDVSKEDEILETFKWVESEFGGVDVLVNNAGIIKRTMLSITGNSEILRDMVDINLMGLLFCTREAVQSMMKRTFDGHIIHINSVLGHSIPFFSLAKPELNIYGGVKHAVTAATETLRQELIYLKTKIKVTSISPGACKTEMSQDESVPNAYRDIPWLNPEDVSQGVIYALSTAPHVQVHELTLKPIGEQF